MAHLGICGVGWTESLNRDLHTYPDWPLTFSVDYNQKANLDKHDSQPSLRDSILDGIGLS